MRELCQRSEHNSHKGFFLLCFFVCRGGGESFGWLFGASSCIALHCIALHCIIKILLFHGLHCAALPAICYPCFE